jgi:putative acetyltransferase
VVVIEIRREELTSETAQALITMLNAELRSRYPGDGVSYFRLDPQEVRPGRGAFLVAYAGGIAAGCGAIRLIGNGTAEIKRMYVTPVFRQRGVARRVLEALEAEARNLGVTRALLETGTRQPEAIALYKKAGYSPTGSFGEYRLSPLNVFMEKRM